MRRYVVLLLWSLPLFAQQPLSNAITDLAQQISTSATREEKQKVAVLPLHDLEGQTTELGSYLAEELVTTLFRIGNFKIVERAHLGTLMGELKMQHGGAIDPATAKEIGRIAAVDAIVTGSITELDAYLAVNCRLIDTMTGEVFGAAQTKIAKDDNVREIMRSLLGPSGTPQRSASTPAIAVRDLGRLRITLQSVLPVTTSDGNALRWTLTFLNRDARAPINVALNAQGWDEAIDDRARDHRHTAPVRASIVDSDGGWWTLLPSGVGNVGVVRAGVHGSHGSEPYSPTEIARLLRLRDQLGRTTDDPADGITTRADSIGEGGSNVTFGGGRVTSPEQFFRYRGNAFLTGTTSTLDPGQSTTVTLTFVSSGRSSNPEWAELECEIVVGMNRDYTLHTLHFDRVTLRE